MRLDDGVLMTCANTGPNGSHAGAAKLSGLTALKLGTDTTIPPSADRLREAFAAVELAKIYYTNYKGERGYRIVLPLEIRHGMTDWHPEPQWFIQAFDLEKRALRLFTLHDISDWLPVGELDAGYVDHLIGSL